MNKLLSFFIVFLILLSFALGFTACSRELSYERGTSNGTALYTLTDSMGKCTGSTVTGQYFTGTPLNQSNTIKLQVNVIIIGTYKLKTNQLNGMFFFGSGIFTNTGIQTITLTSVGTPISDGSYDFSTPLDARCFTTVIINKASVADFTLSGAPNECDSAVVNGSYTVGQLPSRNENTVIINVNVTAVGAYTLNTDTIDGLSFSASGTFTTAGNQSVTLIASGIPKLPRNLTFTPLAGTSSCTFPVAVENPPPLATYVLQSTMGNPNPCVYTVSGAYTSGTSLSNSNTISMQVYVTVVGNFTIVSNTVNGMMFSYTGTFTTTGAQYVTLTGSGIPVSPGTYTFTPQIVGPHPIGGEACAFDVTVD